MIDCILTVDGNDVICCGELIERVDNQEYGNIYIAKTRCFETLEEAVEYCYDDEYFKNQLLSCVRQWEELDKDES